MCGVHIEPVVSAAAALPAVRSAFRRARLLREPVLLSVPMTIQDEQLPGEFEYRPSFAVDKSHSRTVPDADGLDSATGLIVSSRRPIILIGHGGPLHAGRRGAPERPDRALYVTTLRAKGALGGSRWNVGVAGTFSRPQTEQLFGEADLVIGVGASMNRFTRQEGCLFSQARTILIVDRPAPAVPNAMPGACHLQGDARLTLDAISCCLRRRR